MLWGTSYSRSSASNWYAIICSTTQTCDVELLPVWRTHKIYLNERSFDLSEIHQRIQTLSTIVHNIGFNNQLFARQKVYLGEGNRRTPDEICTLKSKNNRNHKKTIAFQIQCLVTETFALVMYFLGRKLRKLRTDIDNVGNIYTISGTRTSPRFHEKHYV